MSYLPSRILTNEQVFENYFFLRVKPLIRPRRKPLPPQFSLVWVPGVDLIPLSYACYEDGITGFLYKVVGDGTRALSLRKPGDFIAITDPIGRSFLPEGGVLFLAGGSGIAPVLHYLKYVRRFRGVWGVKYGRLAKAVVKLFPEVRSMTIVSEDCTYGLCGLLTDHLDKISIIPGEVILVSGPVEMVKKVCHWLKNLGINLGYVIAENMVKCGLGACGSCVVGGIRLCKEGPLVGCDAFD